MPSCEMAVLGSELCRANPGGPSSSTGQVCICILCALLMRTRHAWLFAAPLLPVLARLCGFPLHALPIANTFAAILTSTEVLFVLSSHILIPFQLAAAACREILQVSGAASLAGRISCPAQGGSLSHPAPQAMELYRLLALGVSLWSQLSVPLLFLVFWLVLFSLRLSSFLASSSSPLAQQGLLFVLLSR